MLFSVTLTKQTKNDNPKKKKVFKDGRKETKSSDGVYKTVFHLLVLTFLWIGWLVTVGPPLAPPPLMVATVKLYARPGNIPPRTRLVRSTCVTDRRSGGVHCRLKLS